MEKMNDLKDLLKHEIEDLYSVEEQILAALPKMIEKANNPDLKKALTEHYRVTEQHKTRLDKIQQTLEKQESSNKKKGFLSGLFGSKHHCKGMAGIIEEGNKIMSADISPEALDAAIIASAQKVEHYEICGYGTAKSFAKELGMEQIAKQLEQTLNEEYEADVLLTQLAEARVNIEAENASEGSSASSRGRSAGRTKEKAGREMEMEAVSNGRGKSSGRGSTTSSRASSSKSSSKPSGSSRSENSSRTGASSKKAAGNSRGSSRSASNGRSSSDGRGSTNSRGRK